MVGAKLAAPIHVIERGQQMSEQEQQHAAAEQLMHLMTEALGTALAAFNLAQLAVLRQVQTGALPKDLAAQILKQSIETNSAGSNPAQTAAAEKLQIVLDLLQREQRGAH
jgi:hypothetical protein